MQYPIIDLITSAYINNGWTGLDISTGKNLFDYQNVASTITLTNNNGVFTNAVTDSRTFVRWRLRLRQGNTTIYNSPITTASLGNNSTTIDTTEYDYDVLAFLINGIDRDMIWYYPFSGQGIFTFSFNLISNDPTVIGGIIFDEVQLETGSEATPYEPYGVAKNDFPNRLKLPLPHYFPHPVIDALQRAAAGTQTADDTEILQHYLTPLGIGGI